MISVWLFLAGIAGGFIAGLLGVGGGIIFLVVLPFALLEFGVVEADLVQYIVANSLFGVFFASLAGNIAHITIRSFHLKESLLVGIAGSIAAILVLNFIVIQPWYTRWIFNVVIILFLLYILITQFLNPSHCLRSSATSGLCPLHGKQNRIDFFFQNYHGSHSFQ